MSGVRVRVCALGSVTIPLTVPGYKYISQCTILVVEISDSQLNNC